MKIISFLLAQNQILLHILALATAPIWVQSLILVEIAVGLIASILITVYFRRRARYSNS